jgi:hypothetical protein
VKERPRSGRPEKMYEIGGLEKVTCFHGGKNSDNTSKRINYNLEWQIRVTPPNLPPARSLFGMNQCYQFGVEKI